MTALVGRWASPHSMQHPYLRITSQGTWVSPTVFYTQHNQYFVLVPRTNYEQVFGDGITTKATATGGAGAAIIWHA